MIMINNTLYNPRFNFDNEHWMISQISSLRYLIIRNLQFQLDSMDSKIENYFKRAFTRWIFNAVKLDKNPFKDRINVKDLIIEDDIQYFFDTNEQFGKIDIDWSFLEENLNIIYDRLYDDNFYKGSKYRISLEIEIYDNQVIFKRGTKIYKITKKQWKNAKRRFTIDPSYFNECLCVIVARYDSIGTKNNHCSAPQSVIQYSRAYTELFGSPLNTCLSQYCSPFPDFEQYFGSLGSFFDFKIETGIYFMNPPYDEELMTSAVNKMLSAMKDKNNYEITVIMVIPMWDVESQEIYRGRIHVDKEYKTLQLINNSKFLRSKTVLNIEKHPFYNYFYDEHVEIADTHLIILSNANFGFTAKEIAHYWEINRK